MHQGMVGGGRKGPYNPYPAADTWIHCLSPGQPAPFAVPLCSAGSRAAPCRSRMVQASSYPDTLRFRLPLFPSYYGNWQIYVTNEIFCLKPLIACLLLPPILLLSTINSARLGRCRAVPCSQGAWLGLIHAPRASPTRNEAQIPTFSRSQAINRNFQACGKAQCPQHKHWLRVCGGCWYEMGFCLAHFDRLWLNLTPLDVPPEGGTCGKDFLQQS